MTTLAMVLAMDRNKLIGKAGGLPWHIPGELANFKAITMGKPVIMGRKTFDSLPGALPGRTNIVVTRDASWSAPSALACTSLTQALQAAETCEHFSGEAMVIGGAALCREAMPQTDIIYLTYIDAEFEGDVWFDSFDWNDWQEQSRDDRRHEALAYSYLVLDRKVPLAK